MKIPSIAITYHSEHGHTKQAAVMLQRFLEAKELSVHNVPVEEAEKHWQQLHNADAIIFGCPTLFGNVSATFKAFMEKTGAFWYKQLWKDKLAAGFTVSSTVSGDKLHTLMSMAVFAAQHIMHWINMAVLPRFFHDQQTDGQNRLGSYLGLMLQSDNSQTHVSPFHDGDVLFADRIAHQTKTITLNHRDNDTNRN
jgi:multimeric flavodoxin WrbA